MPACRIEVPGVTPFRFPGLTIAGRVRLHPMNAASHHHSWVSAPVRLVTLLLLAVGYLLAEPAVLLALSAAIASLFALECGGRAVLNWLAALRQLKWLFIALAVLYLGFTPGEPLIAGWDRPSWQGLSEGAHRALVLAMLLLAVHWLVRPLPADDLAGGVVWLATPLSRLGVRTERFAVRLALTLQQVAELQARVTALREQASRGWIEAAGGLVQEIESASPPVERRWIELVTPRAHEWLLPALLGAILLALVWF